jgi:(R)-2-hydroxyacyl-CoA dehydratese activating ATPase
MICAGIDAGSRTTKVVLLEAESLAVVAWGVRDQGVQQDSLATALLEELLQSHGLPRNSVGCTVATGYGRKLIHAADSAITEITCQAHGVRHRAAEVRTIIDIGGQDSKLIRLDGAGMIEDFVMNDRCAAGTGRFLEVLAARLGIQLNDLGELAGKSCQPAIISSMCVVFAETEIIGLLASGAAATDIVAGVQESIAARVAAMAGGSVAQPIIFTGGVALVSGMAAALQTVLHQEVKIASQPQTTAALGAALLAARQLRGLKTLAL